MSALSPAWPRAAAVAASPASLRVKDLSLHYPLQIKRQGLRWLKQPPVQALDGVSMTVRPGECVGVLGPNGSGKTSLLRAIAGFERPSSGAISLGARILAHGHVWVPPQERGIGMVFQDLALFPHMTVAQNVAFGLHAWSSVQRRQQVDKIGELCQISALMGRHAYELSGGQQQRVALARALAPQPQLLLLDEPFAHLDPPQRRRLGEELRELLKYLGMSAIMVMHDPSLAFELSDRLALIWEGKLVQFGSPQQVFHYPTTSAVAEFLGERSFIPCTRTSTGYRTAFGTIAAHRISYQPPPAPDVRQLEPELGAELVLACKRDDFRLLHQAEAQPYAACTPQPFTIIAESFKGCYTTIRAQLPSGHIVTFEHSAHDDAPLKQMKICLKDRQFCVYAVADEKFTTTPTL